MTEHFPPRTSKRAPIETRVRFRFADLEDFEVRQSMDLSLGGMFLKTENPPPPGTRVDFELTLTDATELIRGAGEVVWCRETDQGPGKPAGMGIRFLKLSPGSRAIIFHAVDRWIQKGGEPFDVEAGTQTKNTTTAPPPKETAVAEEPAEPAVLPPLSMGPETSDDTASDATASDAAGTTMPPAPSADGEPPGADRPEPLSELVARTTGAASSPARPPDSAVFDPGEIPAPKPGAQAPGPEESGELGSTRPGGVSFVRSEPSGPRWGRLAVVAALAILVAAGVSFVWLRDHDPSPPSTETSEVGGTSPNATESAAGDPPPVTVDGEAGASPATADPAAAETVAAEGSEPPPSSPVTRIENISWNRSGEGTEVILVGDGSFELQRWTNFHLGGSNPREVVKIRGIAGPYERSFLPVGSPEVRQVRTGFHTSPGSNELHVVLDLADPRVEATQVEARGRTLRIRLTGPRS